MWCVFRGVWRRGIRWVVEYGLGLFYYVWRKRGKIGFLVFYCWDVNIIEVK